MNQDYIKPEICEVIIPSNESKICNSEAFSCYISLEDRLEFMKSIDKK